MMQLAELQAFATNIVVISVALLAVTIIMFSSAWQGLLHYIGLLSVQGRRDIATTMMLLNVAFLALFGVFIAMAYVSPDMVRVVIFFVALVIAVVEILYLSFIFVWNILRHRRLPRFRRSREPDVEEWEKTGTLVYSASVFNLVLATLSFAFSVLAATDTTVGTGIRPDPAEDVDFSRWLLSAGTTAFLSGLMLLGFGKYIDLYRFLGSKGRGEEMRDSAPEDHDPTDQDEACDIAVGNYQESPE